MVDVHAHFHNLRLAISPLKLPTGLTQSESHYRFYWKWGNWCKNWGISFWNTFFQECNPVYWWAVWFSWFVCSTYTEMWVVAWALEIFLSQPYLLKLAWHKAHENPVQATAQSCRLWTFLHTRDDHRLLHPAMRCRKFTGSAEQYRLEPASLHRNDAGFCGHTPCRWCVGNSSIFATQPETLFWRDRKLSTAQRRAAVDWKNRTCDSMPWRLTQMQGDPAQWLPESSQTRARCGDCVAHHASCTDQSHNIGTISLLGKVDSHAQWGPGLAQADKLTEQGSRLGTCWQITPTPWMNNRSWSARWTRSTRLQVARTGHRSSSFWDQCKGTRLAVGVQEDEVACTRTVTAGWKRLGVWHCSTEQDSRTHDKRTWKSQRFDGAHFDSWSSNEWPHPLVVVSPGGQRSPGQLFQSRTPSLVVGHFTTCIYTVFSPLFCSYGQLLKFWKKNYTPTPNLVQPSDVTPNALWQNFSSFGVVFSVLYPESLLHCHAWSETLTRHCACWRACPSIQRGPQLQICLVAVSSMHMTHGSGQSNGAIPSAGHSLLNTSSYGRA